MEVEHVNHLIYFDEDSSTSRAMEIAGVGARAYAFVIDWHIRLLLALIWIYLAVFLMNDNNVFETMLEQGDTDTLATWLTFLPAASIYFLYHPALELIMQGNTPGKRMADVCVVTLSGTSPGITQILIRNILRLIDGFPGVYTVGLLFAIFTRNHVRLGDIAAGTVLVYNNRNAQTGTKLADPDSNLAVADENDALLKELLARWSQLEKEQRMNLGHQLLDRMGDNFVPGDTAELKRYLLEIAKKKNH